MISVWNPIFTDIEKSLLIECIDSGWISSQGAYVSRFEKRVAEYLGVKDGVSVSSGTAALETALHALDLKPGDEVIMPNFTIISNAVSAIRLGLKPVFVDSSLQTWNIDTELIEAAITKKSRVIVVVHIYGLPVDMKKIMDIANRYNLLVVEDCAEALGATVDGQKAGSFGDVTALSFFANKSITTGEGGMVLSSNSRIIERARNYRNLYFGKGDKKFIHSEIGFNYRMSNIQAALGYGQMTRIDQIVERQVEIATYYSHGLKDIKSITLPFKSSRLKNVYWVYGFVINKSCKMNSRELGDLLCDKGIETRPFFSGMHVQPALAKAKVLDKKKYPVTEYLSSKGLYLPSGVGLSEESQDYIIRTLADVLYNE